MTETTRIMGLDMGEKTIGVAISDVRGQIASPLEILPKGKFSKDAETLKALCEKHGISEIVIGDPVNMDGSIGARAQSVRQFAKNIEKALGVKVVLWDERLSTVAVERTMLDADLSRQRRGELVDKLAAAYILQGYLDSRRI